MGGIVVSRLVRDGEAERPDIARPQDAQSKPRTTRSGARLRFRGQSRKVYGNLGVWPTVKLEGIGSYRSVMLNVVEGSKPAVEQIVVGYLDGWYRHFDPGSLDNRPDQLDDLGSWDAVPLLKLA